MSTMQHKPASRMSRRRLRYELRRQLLGPAGLGVGFLVLAAGASFVGTRADVAWLERAGFAGMTMASMLAFVGVVYVSACMPPPKPWREASLLGSPSVWLLRFASTAAVIAGTLALGPMSGEDFGAYRAAGINDTRFIYDLVWMFAKVALLYGAFAWAVWIIVAQVRTGLRNRRRGVRRAVARLPRRDRRFWTSLCGGLGEPWLAGGILGLCLCWLTLVVMRLR